MHGFLHGVLHGFLHGLLYGFCTDKCTDNCTDFCTGFLFVLKTVMLYEGACGLDVLGGDPEGCAPRGEGKSLS